LLYLDLIAPTTVSPKINLVKGDLFVISLNDDETQKLVMQVDRVDETQNLGFTKSFNYSIISSLISSRHFY